MTRFGGQKSSIVMQRLTFVFKKKLQSGTQYPIQDTGTGFHQSGQRCRSSLSILCH
jgi:hypothetical protein